MGNATSDPAPAKLDVLVSVVVCVKNDAHLIDGFASEVVALLSERYTDYEVIFVDDASTDGTPERIDAVLARHDGIRYLRLSRSFGREVALYAGMQSAIGDYVTIMSIHTDPPRLIPQMVERAVRHGGLVFGVSSQRLNEPALFGLVKSLFIFIAVRLLRIPLVKDATQFMVFSRQALNAILEIKDRYRHIRVFTSYIGYAQEGFEYVQENREGKAVARPLGAGIGAGIRIIFASTSVPMRAWAWLGVLVALVNSGLGVAAAVQAVHHGGSWVTQAAGVSTGLVLLVFSGVLALLTEYVTTLTEESRNRPLYYIREEKSSSVLLGDSARRNVTR